MKTHYQPVEGGYQIIGSNEIFNRALYGGHSRDEESERFFTFAGDQPLVMGTCNEKISAYHLAKCGVFMAGLAMTPGRGQAVAFSRGKPGGDRYAQWFHEAEGTITTFRNGWMEYDLQPFFQVFPQVKVFMQVLPLQSEPGFLVHLRIWTEQRINLVIGFGGITDFLGPFGARNISERNFSPDDCRGNKATLGNNQALIENQIEGKKDSFATKVRIGTSFAVNLSLGDAGTVTEGPGAFLARDSKPGETPMVRMDCAIEPYQTWEGFAVVIQNGTKSELDHWLQHQDPVKDLKREISAKRSIIRIDTPDQMLDLTVPPTVLALDACWHKNTFCHGTYEWHIPHLGWRNWYGPTVIGWHERVAQAIRAHGAGQVTKSDQPEKILWEYSDFDKQNLPHHTLEGSTGFIPSNLDGKTIFYNMQEVYVDHFLHHLEWTADMNLAAEMFPVISRVLDWEERLLDPDNDGLYQNWLNTWVSDGHHYNGGGCAQSSAYNYRANVGMARLAEKLGHDPKPFRDRAEKIRKACQDILWLPDKGVMAEYIDTVGNKLIHPSPELATTYHCIESGIVDAFQAYQMLRFTETTLRNERTMARGGRLAWSSDWYPQMYSSCGIYTAENMHLAWAYFGCGLAEKGLDILTAVVDAHFLGYQPGMACHNLSGSGHPSGSQDFTDVLSMHLRLIVEGLFGIRFNLPEQRIDITPNFPLGWEKAEIKIADTDLQYLRKDRAETLVIKTGIKAKGVIRLPLRSTTVEAVTLDGQPVDYHIQPAIGRACLVVETDLGEEHRLSVIHGKGNIPSLTFPKEIFAGQEIHIKVDSGIISEHQDPSGSLSAVEKDSQGIRGQSSGAPGWHTIFVRVKKEKWDGWLPVDFCIKEKPAIPKAVPPGGRFSPVDISKHYNISLAEIHKQQYLNPRPKGYSLMVWPSGRYCWDWNAGGYNARIIDDSALRSGGGTFIVPSGVPFQTPASGPNTACVSIWENFPTETSFPLSGKGNELAILFIGVTNPMQSRVENGCFSVAYADGTKEAVSLVNPTNFHDWLSASIQTENESVCFSDYNHGLVQRIILDPSKELKSFVARAVANEVIIGILGISMR